MTDNVQIEITNRRWRRAITALLTQPTLIKAAEAAGCSERTLRRYLQDPAFKMALSEAEGEAINEAVRTLLAGQPHALATLAQLMKSAKSEANRRLAAVSWIDFTLRFLELQDIQARLLELEQWVFYERHKQAN